MDDKNIKALVSLLDDEDQEVIGHVENQIISMGNAIIPYLEHEWESNFNPDVQKRIEDLIHNLQFEALKQKFEDWGNSQEQDLLEGMWLVASYQYPDLSYEELKKKVEQLYYNIWVEVKTLDLHPFDQVKALNNAFFGKTGFGANTKNFHSPSNSMINHVLDTKKGNPISLCVIYHLVAQKLNLPIYGVNLPNLFILTYKDNHNQFYINAFNKGLIFSKSDIENYIAHLSLKPNKMFFEPCSNIDIIRRVLRNLTVSFEKIGEAEKVNEVKILLDKLSGEASDNTFGEQD